MTPSNFLVKAVGVWPLNRLFVREYSTRTRFQRAQALTTQGGKHFWPLLTSISALTVAALAIDDSMAFRNGETLCQLELRIGTLAVELPIPLRHGRGQFF